ncbi:MAG: hypothetical protein Q9161_006813 [Pseudevernia consocians]
MEGTVGHARLPIILNTPRGASCGKEEPNGIIEALLENSSHSLATLENSWERESTSGIDTRMLNLDLVPEQVDCSDLVWLDVPGKSEQEAGDRQPRVFVLRWSSSYQPDCAKLQTGLSKPVMDFYSDRIAQNCNDVHRLVDQLLDLIGKL